MQPEVSIVIPVYNEEGILSAAMNELCENLGNAGYNYEVILAENGSTDRTAALARELSLQNPRIQTLSTGEPNYGRALKQGILLSRGQYVVCDEIDLCDIDFYARALPLLRDGSADLVVGSKTMSGANDQRPLIRRVATRVMSGMLRVTLNFRGTDTHGLKAFNRRTLLKVVERCVVERDLFASEFVIRAGRVGKRVVEIPVRVQEKRRPSINLFKRVPHVMGNLARLTYLFWSEPSTPPEES
jgi:glycosyltransferase involved in cell wall biosynthesis